MAKLTENQKNRLRKIKSHLFGGKKYKMEWTDKIYLEGVQCNGTCNAPEVKDKKIQLDITIDEADLLKAVIDEGVHANVYSIDNDYVDQIAESVADLLIRMGFVLRKD